MHTCNMTHSRHNRVRDLRLERGMSTALLALAAGCDRSTVVRVEAGQVPLTDTAQAIAAALGVSTDEAFPPVEDGRGAAA